MRMAAALCNVGDTYRDPWTPKDIGGEFELNIAAAFAAGGSPFAPTVRARFRVVFDAERAASLPEGQSSLIQRIA